MEQRADPLGVLGIAPEVRAPDDCPRTDPEVVEACGDECCDPALGPGPVLEVIANRIPEERRHVVLPVREVGLRVDRDEARSVAKDVVVAKAAGPQPVSPWRD